MVKKKHIFSHGYNPRFYNKFKDHRIMMKLDKLTNTIRIIISSSKEDTHWCAKNDYENDNCININGKKTSYLSIRRKQITFYCSRF